MEYIGHPVQEVNIFFFFLAIRLIGIKIDKMLRKFQNIHLPWQQNAPTKKLFQKSVNLRLFAFFFSKRPVILKYLFMGAFCHYLNLPKWHDLSSCHQCPQKICSPVCGTLDSRGTLIQNNFCHPKSTHPTAWSMLSLHFHIRKGFKRIKYYLGGMHQNL
jgi:hypothetical protein